MLFKPLTDYLIGSPAKKLYASSIKPHKLKTFSRLGVKKLESCFQQV